MRNIAMLLAALMALVGFTSPASAGETYHGFVSDEHYLGRGGTPATFEEIAANPLSVLRSETAYRVLRAHISSFEGYNLSDADFRALMRSDRVKLVPCIGIIDTAGVTDSGRVGYRPRNCYAGEMLIELTLKDGSRVVVASQGCYNPIRSMPVYPPAPAKVAEPRMTPSSPPAVTEKDYSAPNPTSSVIDIDLPSMGSSVIIIGGNVGARNDCGGCPDESHNH